MNESIFYGKIVEVNSTEIKLSLYDKTKKSIISMQLLRKNRIIFLKKN